MGKQKSSWLSLLLLILAGESVFILPFVLPRVFRPTVLDVFRLDNLQLGLCFSVYGIVALFSYLIGGPLADRFAPRKLIAVALWFTALGGLVYATFPSYGMQKALYGYWGFTTIFLFWAPMIKATRVWGGSLSQGKAFGFLDGGRGLVGASFGTLGVLVFSLFLTSEIAEAQVEETRAAFRYVILISSAIVSLVGIAVWFFLNDESKSNETIVVDKLNLSNIWEVLRLPSVWLLMIIILTAYVGYKVTDVISLYAQDVMLFDQVKAAKVGTFLLFIRPVVGVLIGILADRSQITFCLFASFVITFFGSLLFASGFISDSSVLLFFLSIVILSTGVYAARSLYFGVMQKGRIPLVLTGTAVGLISLVGYTPDIFAGPVIGYLLDQSPGAKGQQNVFAMLAGFSLIGSIASFLYYWLYRKDGNIVGS